MTRKEEFMKAYEAVKDKALEGITLLIRMPTGEIETILNPKVAEKVTYIDKTYNDDLVHANCDKIRIENYGFDFTDDEMDFGTALMNLKAGHKVSRKGWNGKGQYIELAENISYQNMGGCVVNCDHKSIGNKAIAFVGTSGVQMGWLASQADMLSEDWTVVE